MKKDRIPELHFYEWSVPRWVLSSTHDALDATGRGIYRELLDLCYTQGGFPFDMPLLCRKCACTEDQFTVVWRQIQRHFPKDKHDPDHRINTGAALYRKQYFAYISKQRRNRKTRGENSGTGSAEESTSKRGVVKSRNNGGSTHNTIQHKTIQDKTTQEELTQDARTPPPPPVGYSPGVLADDDSWVEFRSAGESYGWKFSDVEWNEARSFQWNQLAFPDKLCAVAGIRERIDKGDDSLVRSTPKNYLKDRKWERAIHEPFSKKRASNSPAWLEDAKRKAEGRTA